MFMMLFGLAVFLGVHVAGSRAAWRARFVDGLGERQYKGFFSLLAVGGLLLTAYGYGLWRAAGSEQIWIPPIGLRHLTLLLMVFAAIAVVASFVPSHIKAWLKHPLLVGVKIWALAHLLAKSDLASMVLFLCVLAWAVYLRIAAKSRGAPLLVAPAGYGGDAVVVVGGLALYLALAFLFHPYVIGVPVMG